MARGSGTLTGRGSGTHCTEGHREGTQVLLGTWRPVLIAPHWVSGGVGAGLGLGSC